MKITQAWPLLLSIGVVTYFSACTKVVSPVAAEKSLATADTVTDSVSTCPDYVDSVKRSLWAYYKFNGNFADSSGNNRNVTGENSIALGKDILGNANSALSFNGTSNYAVIDSGVNFPAGNFTVSMLCLFNSTSGNRIFQKVNYSNATGASFGFGFSTTAGDAFSFFVATDSNVCADIPNSSLSLLNLTQTEQTGIWYYVTIVFNNGTLSTYVDGTLQGSLATSHPTFETCSDAPFYLGTWWSEDPLYYSGEMDELRIYSRALSQGEITYLANNVVNL